MPIQWTRSKLVAHITLASFVFFAALAFAIAADESATEHEAKIDPEGKVFEALVLYPELVGKLATQLDTLLDVPIKMGRCNDPEMSRAYKRVACSCATICDDGRCLPHPLEDVPGGRDYRDAKRQRCALAAERERLESERDR